MSARLVARGLAVHLGGRAVVDDVSLALRAGEWVALVGPNGAGKSTLLAALAGLVPLDGGTLALDDRPLADWAPRERARRVAWLAQAGDGDGEVSVRDVVRLGRLPHHGLLGAPAVADEAAVSAAMAEVGVDGLASRRLSALSGGERQRALIARAFAVEAPVLLLDEPTAHLDAPHQRTLARGLRARAAAGTAVASVLSCSTLALQADRVIVLARGRVQADGAPSDPALRQALEAAFDHAFAIVDLARHPAVDAATGARWPRWAAVALA